MAYRDEKAAGESRTSLEACLKKLQKYAETENIADDLSDEELGKIGTRVKQEYDIDKASLEEWSASAKKAMDVALQVRTPKNYPFEKASNVKYPLVTVAALQFGARAYPAIVDGNRIVKGQVIGEDAQGQKREKAERIGQHMSWQLLYEMEEWEEDTDVLLHHLPIVGCAFRKVWRDNELGRNKAEMVPAINLVVNNKVRNLAEAPRITHEIPMFPQQIKERMRSGTFLEVELPSVGSEGASDRDAQDWLLEQHCYIDLDGDDFREPYIVTIHKDSGRVLRIVANYEFDEIVHDGKRITMIPRDQYFVKYGFLPDPCGGFYDVGFGKLLESLSETIDTTINQMLDAATLQNSGGGFIAAGLNPKKGEIRRTPGKYHMVEAVGSTLKDSIVGFEDPGPSAVSFTILELMLSAASDITGVKDVLTGEATDQKAVQPTTVLAMIDQGLKVFTAIYKRIYRSLKQEYKLLFYLNAKYLEDAQYFTVTDQQQSVAKQDYDWDAIDVMPTADPKMVTDMQRMARAQFLQGFLGTGLINDQAALLRIFDAAGIDKPMELMPQGMSPVQELQLKNAAAEIDNKIAEMEKKQAETQKIKVDAHLAERAHHLTEVQALADLGQGDIDNELAYRQQDHDEASAAHDWEMAGRQQDLAEGQAMFDAHNTGFDQGMAGRQQAQAEQQGAFDQDLAMRQQDNEEYQGQFDRDLSMRQQDQSEYDGARDNEREMAKMTMDAGIGQALGKKKPPLGKKARERMIAAKKRMDETYLEQERMNHERELQRERLTHEKDMAGVPTKEAFNEMVKQAIEKIATASGQKAGDAMTEMAKTLQQLAQSELEMSQKLEKLIEYEMSEVEIERDKSGRIASVTKGGRRMVVKRDASGRAESVH